MNARTVATIVGPAPTAPLAADVAQLEEPGEHDGRDAEQEGVARGGAAVEAEEQAGGDRRAGAADAGHERERLEAADDQAVAQRQVLDLAVALADALGDEHHDAEERSAIVADELQRAHVVLDLVVEQRGRRSRSGSCRAR